MRAEIPSTYADRRTKTKLGLRWARPPRRGITSRTMLAKRRTTLPNWRKTNVHQRRVLGSLR